MTKHKRTQRQIMKEIPLELLPTEEDLQRVDKMDPCDCPRRYCWHWRSLSLEWDIPVSRGCDADRVKINWKGKQIPRAHDTPCKRRHSESPHDHYEPRDPTFIEDGLPIDRWNCE